jgi:hypothetical protein
MTVARGCGTRVKGGVYAEIPLSPFGIPFDDFLFCPPIVVDAQAMGITSIGVKLIERDGVFHVFDVVGKQHYPNVLDFVEEARRFGISRRLPKTLEFNKITAESRLILMHDRAFIENFNEFHGEHICPKDKDGHDQDPLPEMCISLWGDDLIKGEEIEGRRVKRVMPSFEYEGNKAPEGVVSKYKLAIFAAFPIPRLAVVDDPEEGTHKDALGKAKNAGIPVHLVDE